jgi:hypothetical protein
MQSRLRLEGERKPMRERFLAEGCNYCPTHNAYVWDLGMTLENRRGITESPGVATAPLGRNAPVALGLFVNIWRCLVFLISVEHILDKSTISLGANGGPMLDISRWFFIA